MGINVGVVLANQSPQQNSPTQRQLTPGPGFGAEHSCTPRENAAPFSLGGAQTLLSQHRAGSCHSSATVLLARAALEGPLGTFCLQQASQMHPSPCVWSSGWELSLVHGGKNQGPFGTLQTIPTPLGSPSHSSTFSLHLLLAPEWPEWSGDFSRRQKEGGQTPEGSSACSVSAHSRLVLGCQTRTTYWPCPALSLSGEMMQMVPLGLSVTWASTARGVPSRPDRAGRGPSCSLSLVT